MTKNSLKNTQYHQGAGYVAPSLAATLSIAALTNQDYMPLGVAACSFEIDIEQPWQQILPNSDFSAFDGRLFEVPGNKWKIDDISGAALAEHLNKRSPVVVDDEHQTINAKTMVMPV